MQPLMTQNPGAGDQNFGAPVAGPEGDNWMGPVGEQLGTRTSALRWRGPRGTTGWGRWG